MPLDNARQACRFLLSRVRSQVEGLVLDDYPGDHEGPRKWISIIFGIVDTANSYVEKSNDASIASAEAKEYLSDANELAESAYSLTKLISGAGLQDLPYPVVQPLQRWYQQVGLNETTLFRTDLVANYEIRPIEKDDIDSIRNKSTSLVKAIANIEWPLQCFTVPGKAFGMLPHFAIVGHEIGHAIYHKIGWNFPDFAHLDTELDNRVRSRLGGRSLLMPIILFKRRVYLNWLQEIASDAFGLLIAGPAFYFAACGLIQALGGGFGISGSHPSNELRRQVLHSKLTEWGFADAFEKTLGMPLSLEINSELFPEMPDKEILFQALSMQLTDDPDVSSDERAAILVELPVMIQALVPEIYEQAEAYMKRVAPEMIYTCDMFKADLDEHYRPLLEAIPPIEKGIDLSERLPVEFASILNVGWAVLLSNLDRISVKDFEPMHPDAARFEKLHALLLKGLELAEARRDWMEA